jgi:hypothetical protein
MRNTPFENSVVRRPADPRTINELVSAALVEFQHPEGDVREAPGLSAIVTLQERGTREVLHAAMALCDADEPIKREIGALILGQLGSPGRSFSEECCDRLLQLVREEQIHDVLLMAVFALGHLGNRRADSELLWLRTHASPYVRHGLAFALAGTTHPDAIKVLLELMCDEDECTRDWATTSIGGTVKIDGPEIRDALLERVSDPDAATRGEALSGLARRREERVLPYLVAELEGRSGSTNTDRDESHDCYFRDAAKIYLGLPEDDDVELIALVSALRRAGAR